MPARLNFFNRQPVFRPDAKLMRPPTPLPRVHIPPRLLSQACSAESAQQSTFHPPKATALRRMSERFLERSEPPTSATCTRPLISSSSPRLRRQVASRLHHHRSGQRTNHQRTDSFRSPRSLRPATCDVMTDIRPEFGSGVCCVRVCVYQRKVRIIDQVSSCLLSKSSVPTARA